MKPWRKILSWAQPQKPEEIVEREKNLIDVEAKDEGGGYWSLIGKIDLGFQPPHYVAYVRLPEDHPDVGKDESECNVAVNGGLTYASGTMFGWDYAHGWNVNTSVNEVLEDMKDALWYFRSREAS